MQHSAVTAASNPKYKALSRQTIWLLAVTTRDQTLCLHTYISTKHMLVCHKWSYFKRGLTLYDKEHLSCLSLFCHMCRQVSWVCQVNVVGMATEVTKWHLSDQIMTLYATYATTGTTSKLKLENATTLIDTHPLFEPGPATWEVKNNQNIKMWTNKFIFVANTIHAR